MDYTFDLCPQLQCQLPKYIHRFDGIVMQNFVKLMKIYMYDINNKYFGENLCSKGEQTSVS